MHFNRLLENERGQIVLLNLRATLRENLLEDDLAGELLPKISAELGGLVAAYTPKQLIEALGRVVWKDPAYQLSARETPSPLLRIAAVRTLDDLGPILHKIRKVHAPPELASLFDPPTSSALIAVADVINRHSEMMSHLTIGAGYNAFWATTLDAIKDLETTSSDLPHDLRDALGLVQHSPSEVGSPIHLFVFEGVAPLNELPDAGAFRCARPTTLDAFDNHRFRQERPATLAAFGCGATVDLRGGGFVEGMPEIISTEMPLKGRLRCRYVGPVLRDPVGSDADFVRFLADEDEPLHDVAAELDARMGRA